MTAGRGTPRAFPASPVFSGQPVFVLQPFSSAEAMTVEAAAVFAGVSRSTIRNWCATYRIGRRIVGGRWRVSKPALQMLVDGDRFTLERYLGGIRDGGVLDYFRRVGISPLA